MSIWFFVWLLLSATLLYIMGWTYFILHRQRQAWSAYAKRKHLRYKQNGNLDSPEMNGTIGAYTVSLFTGEHIADDRRNTRKLTAIEVQLSSVMPVEGGIASGGLVDIVREVSFKEEYRPKHERWDKSYIVSADSRGAMEIYLTKERLDVLTDLMAMKSAWTILIFKGDMTLLRIDTPDPLDNRKKLESLIAKVLEAAAALELKDGEGRMMKEQQIRRAAGQISLEIDDESLKNIGLELDDDI